MRVFAIMICMAAVGAVAGCEKSVDKSEPGVYQGQMDPLLETQKDPAQQEKLRERFNEVQTDR